MKITLQNERSVSPGALSSHKHLDEADKIRLQGKIALLTMKNDLLAKQLDKSKASSLPLSELDSTPSSQMEMKKRGEDLIAAQREITLLRKEKNAAEIEAHASQRKVQQLQHEISVVNRELEKFTDNFGKQIEVKLASRNQEVESLSDIIEQMKTESSEKDKIINILVKDNQNLKSILKTHCENLRSQQKKIADLENLGHKELELKRASMLIWNSSIEQFTSEVYEKVVEELGKTATDLGRRLESLEIENSYLRQEIVELRRDLTLHADGGPPKDFSIVKPRSDNKLFTQGTLLLDYCKMFEPE